MKKYKCKEINHYAIEVPDTNITMQTEVKLLGIKIDQKLKIL